MEAASAAIIEELDLETDIRTYMSNSVVITPKLAASMARWPVATKEFVVYRGQPKPKKDDPKVTTKYLPLPLMDLYNKRPFFSTSLGLDVAKQFAEYAYPIGDTFKITVKPGIRYLKLSSMGEAEVLLAADGVADYHEREWVSNSGVRLMPWIVTYSPRTPGTAETPQPAVVEESKPAEPPAETPQPSRPPRPKQLPDRVESKPKPMKLRSSMKKPTAGRRKTRRRSLRRR
jgi:hypothetical protein